MAGEPKEVKEAIEVLECEFDELKDKAISLLEASKIGVKRVVYRLTTMSVSERDEHKEFLKNESDKLNKSEDQMELFGQLNNYWTFLSPHLLNHLVNKLPSLADIKSDMKAYMDDLITFRKKTPLDLFCKVDERCFEQPEGFEKFVVRFKQEKPTKSRTTLQDIEDFRKRHAFHYQLYDFAILLKDEVKVMSFVVTFFIPECVVKLLSKPSEIPIKLFQEFGVTKVDIAGSCIYTEDVTQPLPSTGKLSKDAFSYTQFIEWP